MGRDSGYGRGGRGRGGRGNNGGRGSGKNSNSKKKDEVPKKTTKKYHFTTLDGTVDKSVSS